MYVIGDKVRHPYGVGEIVEEYTDPGPVISAVTGPWYRVFSTHTTAKTWLVWFHYTQLRPLEDFG